MTTSRQAILLSRYEAHVALSQHYSSLVFRGRLATITLTIAAVAISLGLVPGGGSAPKGQAGALLAYAAAVLVSLLYGVETTYVKRFFQVMASGRQIEGELGVADYFSKYDAPHGIPLRTIYFVAVVALLGVSTLGVWGSVASNVLRAGLALAGVVPLIILIVGMRESSDLYDKYLGSLKPEVVSAPQFAPDQDTGTAPPPTA